MRHWVFLQPDDDDDDLRNVTHLDVGSIRSVKVSREGRRNIPKAFEIFTADKKTYVLKAKDGSNAQEWMQCLSVAKAHSQARETRYGQWLNFVHTLARSIFNVIILSHWTILE